MLTCLRDKGGKTWFNRKKKAEYTDTRMVILANGRVHFYATSRLEGDASVLHAGNDRGHTKGIMYAPCHGTG